MFMEHCISVLNFGVVFDSNDIFGQRNCLLCIIYICKNLHQSHFFVEAFAFESEIVKCVPDSMCTNLLAFVDM